MASVLALKNLGAPALTEHTQNTIEEIATSFHVFSSADAARLHRAASSEMMDESFESLSKASGIDSSSVKAGN